MLLQRQHFLLTYFKTRVLVDVWPESNSQLPAWQPGAQPTEPPVHGYLELLAVKLVMSSLLSGRSRIHVTVSMTDNTTVVSYNSMGECRNYNATP